MLRGRRHGASGPGCERRPMIVTHGLTKRYGDDAGRRRPELHRLPRRRHRLSRPERFGEVHHHAHDPRPRRARRRLGARQRMRLRRAVVAAARGRSAARCQGLPPGPERPEPSALAGPDQRHSRGRASTRCSTSSGSRRWPTAGPGSSHSAWDSGSASPAPSWAIPACCSSTSRSTASTPKASAGSATCCVTWPPRAARCWSRAT